MKMEINRHSIWIRPENDTDIAYLEEVLGLKTEKDTCIVSRVNAMGLTAVAYLELHRGHKEQEGKLPNPSNEYRPALRKESTTNGRN